MSKQDELKKKLEQQNVSQVSSIADLYGKNEVNKEPDKSPYRQDDKPTSRENGKPGNKSGSRETDKPATKSRNNVSIKNFSNFLDQPVDKNNQEKFTFIGDKDNKLLLEEIKLLFRRLGYGKVHDKVILNLLVSDGLRQLKKLLDKEVGGEG